MKTFFKRSFLCVVLMSVLLLALPLPAQAGTEALAVAYFGPAGRVQTALELARFNLTASLKEAQVIVINGAISDPQTLQERVRQGAGLVIFLNKDVKSADLSALLGAEISLKPEDSAASIAPVDGLKDPLLEQIIWTSSPQVRERMSVSGGAFTPLVVNFDNQQPVLLRQKLGAGTVFVLTPFLEDTNAQFQDWAYFNYLVYALTTLSAGQEALSFADYPASPVPHTTDQIVLGVMLLVTIGTSIYIFLRVRRYSRAHPELLDTLVANQTEFKEREAQTDWETVGFHRPLGGFMLSLMIGLVLFIPLIIYQNLVLPSYILPSAQALGIWGRVTQFFNTLWLFFDMGTSAAFIKFFSQYRVKDPRRAVLYGQVFVWWQAITGVIQIGLVIMAASTMLPDTAYAIYTWSVIAHVLIQIPGFFQVMRHQLTALQRADYAQILDMGLYLLFPIIAQPIFVSLMVWWGRSNPAYGMATGGLFGMGLAAYATELMAFGVGVWLFRRLGYNARLVFLAHFDFATLKESLRFGVFEMLGSLAWGIGQSMEVLVTQTRLVNYGEIWGNWVVAQNFIFAFNVASNLYNNLMPSISEAISHAKRRLSQYYSVMAYKYGGMISAFIGAVLLAVADRFILGATGPDFVRAAAYVIPLVIWGAVQYPSWVGDNVQLASNRPYLKSILVLMEQIIRVGLVLLLVETMQINALIVGYFVGLITKDVVSYLINDRVCFKQRFYFWQSLGAPLLAGAAHWLVLRWLTGYIWQGDQVTSVLIFLIGILFSYPLFAFFYGLAGGWDDDTLGELKHGSSMAGFVKPLAMLFYYATTAGARISPLHNRFPIDIRGEALDEALQLTQERVKLV
ncbi:MAG TPA: hypothetical protein PKW33_10880 [Anaerolineaceae bacterium]|nr:hypothetical protein [Anaerolineaceae bacterium]HPN52082.1 hypothetical protein [Anaerolineaceae bacterium]